MLDVLKYIHICNNNPLALSIFDKNSFIIILWIKINNHVIKKESCKQNVKKKPYSSLFADKSSLNNGQDVLVARPEVGLRPSLHPHTIIRE